MGAGVVGIIVLPLLKLFSWVFYLQPRTAQRAWAALLGMTLRSLRIRRSVIEENLRLAFPGETTEVQAKRSKLVTQAYSHLGQLTLEIILLFGPIRSFVARYADIRGVEIWRAARAQGKGVIFLSSHTGNWEIMVARGALAGIDIMMVTKRLKPAWLHAAIEKGRESCGVKATYEPKTFRDVLSRLKAGGTVGFVLDQYAGPPIGVRVPFFNVPVGTNSALAMLAKRTGAVILPVLNYRLPNGRFMVDIQPPVSWIDHPNPQRELAANTAAYTEVLEKHIRSHPEQWLWTHRRFKGDLSPLRVGEWDEGRPRKGN